ncbi:CRAL-TRIO domain-containing protein C3H8.02 [Daldinia childiae]|uniref:CRAL-TRIO domain-containing protein C3H8.02 n=1 Tax=Daldinia childiae TaxID=326645 RepID=UPI0014462529|nr:CRAL-TRIO domain-containing protein C3H8.02 [Daldinia childiae]KAF3059674.1 CRAL-TRIO domain-containing protein C3H8.02 [Daldinia childiae]
MEPLPGRPGNLTPEEEEKLRKFWEMFLHVCGVLGEEASGEVDNASESQGKASTAGSEKPRKSRMSIFKKKKDKSKDGAATAKVPAMDNIKENDPEDKWDKSHDLGYGQARPSRCSLLRFLRARKWDLQRALVMLMSTMNWRCSEAHVDDEVMANGEELASINEKTGDEKTKKVAQDFLAQLRMGKSYCYGTDKTGRPICIVRARLHKAGEQSEEGLERFTVYLIETTRFMLHPPIDTACVVFDLTGFSLANMDYTPVKFMIKCFEANYPRVLVLFSFIRPRIWKILRGWLDPVVAGKVHFTNTVKDLEEFVAKERLPDELEGTSGYTYKYVEPVPGENAKMKDLETKEKLLREREALYEDYESKTIEWINETDATKRAAIYSERNTIAKNLREQYWHLDPYIRSRSFFDRIGVIKPDGSLDYYPSKITNGTTAALAAGETSADDVD